MIKEPITQVDSYQYSFGSSQRALSDSNRLFASSDYSVPPPGSYDINKSSRVSYLKNLLGVTQWKLKSLKRKLNEIDHNQKSSQEIKDIQTEIKFLTKRIEALRDEIQLNEAVSSVNTPKFPSPTKPAFNQSSKKPHQEPIKYQEAPTFYKSDSDWDFGSDKRSNTIDMSAWNYSKKYQNQLEVEEISSVLSSTNRYITYMFMFMFILFYIYILIFSSFSYFSVPSHCRSTDFYGIETNQRLKTPQVGRYSPELIPKQLPEIKHESNQSLIRKDDQGQAFTFSRSRKRNQKSYPTIGKV